MAAALAEGFGPLSALLPLACPVCGGPAQHLSLKYQDADLRWWEWLRCSQCCAEREHPIREVVWRA